MSFDHFEALLLMDLAEQWRELVIEECNTTNCVNVDSLRMTAVQGRIFKGLNVCYIKFVHLVCHTNSAEHTKRYITMRVYSEGKYHIKYDTKWSKIEQETGIYKPSSKNGKKQISMIFAFRKKKTHKLEIL